MFRLHTLLRPLQQTDLFIVSAYITKSFHVTSVRLEDILNEHSLCSLTIVYCVSHGDDYKERSFVGRDAV
jgi:hypothetical protein